MKKIKKFFRDVVGEIKEPSEDAGKVLDVIRRVIGISLLLSFLSQVLMLIIIIWTVGPSNVITAEFWGISFGLDVFFRVGFTHVIDIILVVIYFYLFVVINKSIKEQKNIESRLFIFMLLALAILPFIARILGLSDYLFFLFLPPIFKLIISLCTILIIISAFTKLKAENTGTKLSEESIRIRNISILGYVFLACHTYINVSRLVTLLPLQRDFLFYFDYDSFTMIQSWWFLITNLVYTYLNIFIPIILIGIIVLRIKYIRKVKCAINIVFAIYVILNLIMLLLSGAFMGEMIFTAIIIISTGYQNKYKVFDNLGTRTLKKVTEKIKAGLDNYLSVGK